MQDETLRLWDMRACIQGSGDGATPRCLHAFRGHREGVAGVAVRGADAVSYAGQSLGVLSLQVCC